MAVPVCFFTAILLKNGFFSGLERKDEKKHWDEKVLENFGKLRGGKLYKYIFFGGRNTG